MTKNKKLILSIPLIAFSGNVFAESDFRIRAIAGIADYEVEAEAEQFFIDLDYTAELGVDTISDSFVYGGIGATWIFDTWFIDTYYTQSAEGEQAPDNFFTFSDEAFGNVNFDRSDFAINIGKSYRNFSFGFGYKDSKNTFSQSSTQLNSSGVSTSINGDFVYTGPFVSIGTGFQVGRGSLSVNLAYADLDGDFDQTYVFRGTGNPGFSRNFSGDANGISFGIKYSGELKGDWSYSAGYDYYDYSFDVAQGSEVLFTLPDGDTLTIPAGSGASVDETIQSLKFELLYTF